MADILFYLSLILIVLSIPLAAFSNLLNSRDSREKSLEIAKLTNANLELESAVAPRLINQSKMSSDLSGFQGINYEIIVVPDFESRRTAGQLRFVLDFAKWKFISQSITDIDTGLLFFDGITIEENIGPLAQNDNGPRAAEQLAQALNFQKILARTFPSRETLPINTVVIRVGLKPIGYFLDNTSGNLKANQTY